MNRHLVPVEKGRGRIRSSSEGFLFCDSEGYSALKSVIKDSIERSGSNFTPVAIQIQILDLYTEANADYESTKGDTSGHVFEITLEGRQFLLGDERVLRRIN